MSERREYENAAASGKPGKRRVKLPGESAFIERSDNAKTIARKLTLEKRQRQMEAKLGRR